MFGYPNSSFTWGACGTTADLHLNFHWDQRPRRRRVQARGYGRNWNDAGVTFSALTTCPWLRHGPAQTLQICPHETRAFHLLLKRTIEDASGDGVKMPAGCASRKLARPHGLRPMF